MLLFVASSIHRQIILFIGTDDQQFLSYNPKKIRVIFKKTKCLIDFLVNFKQSAILKKMEIQSSTIWNIVFH